MKKASRRNPTDNCTYAQKYFIKNKFVSLFDYESLSEVKISTSLNTEDPKFSYVNLHVITKDNVNNEMLKATVKADPYTIKDLAEELLICARAAINTDMQKHTKFKRGERVKIRSAKREGYGPNFPLGTEGFVVVDNFNGLGLILVEFDLPLKDVDGTTWLPHGRYDSDRNVIRIGFDPMDIERTKGKRRLLKDFHDSPDFDSEKVWNERYAKYFGDDY